MLAVIAPKQAGKYQALPTADPGSPALITPGKKRRPFGMSKDFQFIDEGSEDELETFTTSPPKLLNDSMTSDSRPMNLQRLYDRLMNTNEPVADTAGNGVMVNGADLTSPTNDTNGAVVHVV